MTQPTPYASPFHAAPMLEWRCDQCTLTLHYKQDMGERAWIVEGMLNAHRAKHSA